MGVDDVLLVVDVFVDLGGGLRGFGPVWDSGCFAWVLGCRLLVRGYLAVFCLG